MAVVWLVTLAAGEAALRPSFREHRLRYRRRRLARAKATPISDVRPGAVVKIAGRVEAIAPPIEAPLTARSGVAMLTAADVVAYRQLGSRAPVLTPYKREEQTYDFIVRDDSGVALVHGARARVVAAPSPVSAPTRQDAWLRRHRGRPRFLGVLPRELRFGEAVLEPGGAVAVLGRCIERKDAGDGPYRDVGAATITIDAPRRGVVLIAW